MDSPEIVRAYTSWAQRLHTSTFDLRAALYLMKGAIMDRKLSRRAMLNSGAAAIGGSILCAASVSSQSKPAGLPWQWRHIDPAGIRERAYQSAWSKVACMYGTFDAVIGTLSDRYGSPYNTFPIEATLYGSGGVGGLGSICGTINACGLLFSLFVGKQEDLFAFCQEISLWYEKASLPVYQPKNPKLDIPIVASVANSHLCHISSTTWAKASGHKLLTQQHFERCNRLVADVAMQVATMLNDYSAGKTIYREKLNAFSQGCLSCHGPGKEKADVASGMSCDRCHENPH